MLFSNFHDPFAKASWNNYTHNVHLENSTITVGYPLTFHKDALTARLVEHPDYQKLTITPKLTWNIHAKAVPLGLPAIPKVKNILAVCANKGGVGKSTIATALAYYLRQTQCRVGILDADLYGPNIPKITGTESAFQKATDYYEPVIWNDIALMSMGYLVQADKPLVWRGPMASAYALQMLQKTAWPELDFLIVDLPPGTGDIQLSLFQKAPITAALMVSTAQILSIQDTIKCLGMLNKCQIPPLGLIENMASSHCPHCQEIHRLFPEAPLQQFLQTHKLPLLASLPIHTSLAHDKPWDNSNNIPHIMTQILQSMAIEIAAKHASRPNRSKTSFPPIVPG